jgi:hypothetical protein
MGCKGKKQMHAKSEAQQHLMGAALEAKRTGKAAFPEAGAVAKEMSQSQLERFASKGGKKKK